MKKTRTKINWIKEHLSDEFVKHAQNGVGVFSYLEI